MVVLLGAALAGKLLSGAPSSRAFFIGGTKSVRERAAGLGSVRVVDFQAPRPNERGYLPLYLCLLLQMATVGLPI